MATALSGDTAACEPIHRAESRGGAGVPHGPAPAVGSGGDPVTWQIERQIRLAYDQLGGGAETPPQEARRALEAVEAYLGAPVAR